MRTAEQRTLAVLSTEELFCEYAQTHDQAVKWEIALRYTDLIKHIALQIRGVFSSFTQLDDVINEGLITLADAVDKYDPQKGRFDLYVSKRIRGMIVDLARRQDWIPRTIRQRAQQIEKIMSDTYYATGSFPSDEDIVKQLNITAKSYQEAMENASLYGMLSLDELIENSGQLQLPQDISSGVNCVEHSLLEHELVNALKTTISALKENEQLVLSLYYEKDLKMKDIASVLGISAPRVSQIHARAIQKLRIMMGQYMKNNEQY